MMVLLFAVTVLIGMGPSSASKKFTQTYYCLIKKREFT